MRKIINGLMVILLAGALVYVANQAAATRLAVWYLLLGVQSVFFVTVVIQALANRE